MKKCLKYSVIVTSSITIIGAICIIALITLVNPNCFKPLLEKSVYEATGRQLTLAGDISWKLYPNIGITLSDARLSNPIGYTESNLVTIHSADVSVALIPLLSNHIVVKTLALDGLQLGLTQKNNLNNWTFTPPPSSATPSSNSSEAPKPLQLEMKSFSLTNSDIHYDNWDSKQHIALDKTKFIIDTDFGGVIKFDQATDQLDLSKVNFNYDDIASGKLDFSVQKLANPSYAGNIEFSVLKLNQIFNQLKINKPPRKEIQLLNNISLKGYIKGDSQNLETRDFNFNFSDKFKGKTSFVLKNFTDLHYNGNLNIERFNLNQVLDCLNIAVNQRKNMPLFNNLSIQIGNVTGNKNNIGFNKLKFVFGSTLSITSDKLNIANFNNLQFNGDLSLANISINKLTQQLGLPEIPIANKQILDNFNINTKFVGNSNSLNLSNLRFKLGNSTVNGSLNFSSFKPLSFYENLTIDQLDLANFSEVNGYHVPIKQLHLNGSAKIASNMNFATLNSKQSISAENISIQGISLDKLVLQFNDAINQAGHGSNNVLAIVLNSGQVIDAVNDMKAKFEIATKSGKQDLNQITNLGRFNANVIINNSSINPSDFKLIGPSISLVGNGWLSLTNNKNLSYHTTSQLLVNGVNPIFKKLTFPATITGTIHSPSTELDWASIQKQILLYTVEQNKDQIQNLIKQQINKSSGSSQQIDAVSKSITHAIGQLFGAQ